MAVQIATSAQITVVTAGTRVPMTATDVQNIVCVILSAPAANTGTVYVGDGTVSANNGIAILKGTNQVINAPEGQYIDVHNFYVDAANNNDKLNVNFLKKVN